MANLLALGVALRTAVTSWYFIAPVAIVLGVVAGVLALLYASPGQPKIGVIDLPFIVITDDSAFVISEFLNYAREDDSVKAVVIKMSSPGGGAASSERLYFETQKLREEKPVVMVMNGMVASGGYMMAMGASYTYAQSASLVGNVGVIAFSGPLIPRVLPESLVTTGPYKLSGSSRRDWIGLVEQLREGFGQMVIRERGDRLQLTETELTQGKLYAGVEAARLGLVDEVGSQSDAMEKAAELAGIANYGIVDVNAEVLRQFIQRSRRIFSSEFDAGVINMTETTDPSSPLLAPGSGIETATGEAGGDANLQELRRLLLANGLDAEQDDPLPDFPLEIGRPNLYYLYTGNGY